MKDMVMSTISELEEDTKQSGSVADIDLNSKNNDLNKKEVLLDDNDFDIEDDILNQDDLSLDIDSLQIDLDDDNDNVLVDDDGLNLTNDSINLSKNEIEDEIQFLENMKSKLIVVFEGLQSPNNKKVEAKIDLILNFLEYNLSIVSDRVDSLKHKKYNRD
jgi:hypothetical protein